MGSVLAVLRRKPETARKPFGNSPEISDIIGGWRKIENPSMEISKNITINHFSSTVSKQIECPQSFENIGIFFFGEIPKESDSNMGGPLGLESDILPVVHSGMYRIDNLPKQVPVRNREADKHLGYSRFPEKRLVDSPLLYDYVFPLESSDFLVGSEVVSADFPI